MLLDRRTVDIPTMGRLGIDVSFRGLIPLVPEIRPPGSRTATNERAV